MNRSTVNLRMAVFAAAAAATVVLQAIAIFAPRPAPFTVDEVTQPIENRVCPGDQLLWEARVTVRRVPSVITFFTSIHWADTTAPLPAQVEAAPDHIVYLQPLVQYSRQESMIVPALQPGRYLMRRAGVEEGDSAVKVGYEIPFEVKPKCDSTRP